MIFIATSQWRALINEGQTQKQRFGLYSPPREVYDEVRNSFVTLNKKNFIVELLDEEGKTVSTVKTGTFRPGMAASESNTSGALLIFPSLFISGGTVGFFPGTPEHKSEIYFGLPMDDMRKIRNVQFRYE
jgi:hypothetical protein